MLMIYVLMTLVFFSHENGVLYYDMQVVINE